MPFPNEFTWGVSAAAYQIEGAATTDGRGESVWDTFCRRPGVIVAGDTGDVACDHYHRYETDADLIRDLGARAYRLSISWPRVLPAGDAAPNEAGLDFYDRLIDALLARGVEPWVTLFHWDYPQALQDRGGWLNDDSPEWFASYTRLVVDRLSDRVSRWMTINEPQIFLGAGHLVGVHAPALKLDPPDLLKAIHNALIAHGRAAQVIREHAKSAPSIGWAPVCDTHYPATSSPEDLAAARARTFAVPDVMEWTFCNTWYADPAILGHYPEDGLSRFGTHMPDGWEKDLETIRQPLDFYGVNIYFGTPTRAGASGAPEKAPLAPGHPITMMGWPVTPEALEWGVRFTGERYGLPLYVTENGMAGNDWVHTDGAVHDHHRIDYLRRYLRALERAIDAGADVRGYFQWSVMDNFEWTEGYRKRFGLIYVDYPTQRRIPKDSYHWYQRVIASNGASLADTA